MADFNPKLSKARMQKSGVVDQTAGMDYDLANGLLKTGVQEFGEYQVRNANEEIEKILSSEVAVDAEQEQSLNKARDEIEMEILKEQQGITNAQQKQFNINKVVAQAKGYAPWMSKELDAMQANAMGLTGANKKASTSASNLKTQTDTAKQNLMKTREENSLKFFGTSSANLNDDQYAILREYEQAQVFNQMEEVSIKTEQLAIDRAELNETKLKKLNDGNALKINQAADATFNSLSNLVISSMDKDNLTDADYNTGIATLKTEGVKLKNQVTKMYAEAGMPVNQDYLDDIQKRIDNTEKNMLVYKDMTLEQRRNVKIDELLKVADINDKLSKASMQNLTSLQTKLNLMDKKQLKHLLSKDNGFAKTNSINFFGKVFTDKYTDENDKFNGQQAFADLTQIQQHSGFSLEKTLGEIQAMDLAIQATKTKNFGLSNTATNLMVEGENKDPQTDSANYLRDKQNAKADEVVSLSDNPSEALPFTLSNLKMLSSDNYSQGKPNTEIGQYRSNNAIETLAISASYVTKSIMQNPDSVEIVNGQLVSSDETTMEVIQEMYKVVNKFDDPNAKEKMLAEIVKIQDAAIDSSIINPLIKTIDEELNNNPIYAGLTLAEKQELRDEVISKERTIQKAEAEKKRQAATVSRIADEIGNANKYNKSGVRTVNANLTTLLNGKNLDGSERNTTFKQKLIDAADPDGDATIADRIQAAAYFGLKTKSTFDKVKNFTTDVARNLFGDSIEEKVEAEYDKKLGLPRQQAKFVKAVQNNSLDKDKAAKIYNTILPRYEALEEKQFTGEELTAQEAQLYKYFDKYITAYDKNYNIEEVSLANMPNTFDPTARNITEFIEEQEADELNSNEVGEIEPVSNTVQENFATEQGAVEESSLGDIVLGNDLDNEIEREENMYNLTFDNEIGRGRNDSRYLHVPSETSGVTIGPGYDLGDRTKEEVVDDLVSVTVDEETSNRIAEGAGLKGAEANKFIDDNEDIAITDEQEKLLFDKVLPTYIDRAKKDYDNFNIEGKPSFDELPDTVKGLLVDYSYNVGVSKFPKFFNALIKGDKEEAIKQYKRYTGGVPLGRRNRDTLKVLNAYDFNDLTK